MLILKCSKGHCINKIGGTYFFSMQVHKCVRRAWNSGDANKVREVGVEQRKDKTTRGHSTQETLLRVLGQEGETGSASQQGPFPRAAQRVYHLKGTRARGGCAGALGV